MTRSLADLMDMVRAVSDVYAERFSIDRSEDWYLLKLQEEVGELTAEYLRLAGRARPNGEAPSEVAIAMADEAADVLAMLLLFAGQNQIDLEAALERKWFRYLPQGTSEELG
jgi:NTP pyrophosphatase (non-canonical NTP hydrolase)